MVVVVEAVVEAVERILPTLYRPTSETLRYVGLDTNLGVAQSTS